MDEHMSGIEAAIEAGRKIDLKTIALPNGGVGTIIPVDMKIIEHQPVDPILPDEVQQNVTIDETASFVDYINRFKEDSTVIFASLADNRMTALLNYHDGGDGGVHRRNSHRAVFNFPYSAAWAKWRAFNGVKMSQQELGYFLEEMLLTISDPSHATLLECASDLSIDRVVRFTSGTRRQSGNNELHYKEEDETSGRNGKLVVPEDVTLFLPLFQGALATTVNAKLRYRMSQGKLTFHFDIINLIETEQDAFSATAQEVASATSVPLFFGKAQ